MQLRVKKHKIVYDKSLAIKWCVECQEKPRGAFKIVPLKGVHYFKTENEASLALRDLIFGK